ncbi:hypothetical protein RB195_025931 [Necator americanus]|uniref:Uncharacterized protein n=1 Tax=Necator americanus TaxID=51031 RepID=A0ABR1EUI4_NECAM
MDGNDPDVRIDRVEKKGTKRPQIVIVPAVRRQWSVAFDGDDSSSPRSQRVAAELLAFAYRPHRITALTLAFSCETVTV